jgi:hypothetical protein
MLNIFIPSYHRPNNLKTVNYFLKIGWQPGRIHVVIDDEADDRAEYEMVCQNKGVNLHVFSMEEARSRYDYIHRPSRSRRSAGQARNMFYDLAKKLNIDFYMVQDDDTANYQLRRAGKYLRLANRLDIESMFGAVEKFMRARKIGLFGLSQTGDLIGGENDKLLRNKVMNTTFVLTEHIYRGERGVQDDDTSMFAGVMNEGLFTGSAGDALFLLQTPSATAKGGLTDLYNECKLLNKALVCPIQFPSAIIAEKQSQNGGRLHHRIKSKYLYPRLIKGTKRDNIAWNTYPEDMPFTNEPKRKK